jgi:hypothetical protein
MPPPAACYLLLLAIRNPLPAARCLLALKTDPADANGICLP